MKRTVTITYEVPIEVDEARFSEEFMAAFSRAFHTVEGVEGHIHEIAQHIVARRDSVDGYGDLTAFGVRAGPIRVVDVFSEDA